MLNTQLPFASDRLRECLEATNLSQRRLAELLGCDERLVRRWASGEVPVPWEVSSWLVALSDFHDRNPVPTIWRRRSTTDVTGEINMRNPEGVWTAQYAGQYGTGTVTFVMRKGQVAGIDFTGGVATGTYTLESMDQFHFVLSYQLTQPGSYPVQTGRLSQPRQSFKIDTRINDDMGGGKPVSINTSLGMVQATFRKMMEL